MHIKQTQARGSHRRIRKEWAECKTWNKQCMEFFHRFILEKQRLNEEFKICWSELRNPEDLTKLETPVSAFGARAAHLGLLPLKSSYMIPNNCLAWGSPEIKSFRSPWGMKESLFKICRPHHSLCSSSKALYLHTAGAGIAYRSLSVQQRSCMD